MNTATQAEWRKGGREIVCTGKRGSAGTAGSISAVAGWASELSAHLMAACTAAPLLMPHRIPSSCREQAARGKQYQDLSDLAGTGGRQHPASRPPAALTRRPHSSGATQKHRRPGAPLTHRGQPPRHGHRIVAGHPHDLIKQADIQHLGHKASPNALDLWRQGSREVREAGEQAGVRGSRVGRGAGGGSGSCC
jgi:hypothetical protein